MSNDYYIIKNSDLTGFYWSSELGWCSVDEATIFTADEREVFLLPDGGEWIWFSATRDGVTVRNSNV